jgi:hypothetical protein
MADLVIIARCVACGYTERFGDTAPIPTDIPLCAKCYSPMVAERAEASLPDELGGRE